MKQNGAMQVWEKAHTYNYNGSQSVNSNRMIQVQNSISEENFIEAGLEKAGLTLSPLVANGDPGLRSDKYAGYC